jgi:hypothetical protein
MPAPFSRRTGVGSDPGNDPFWRPTSRSGVGHLRCPAVAERAELDLAPARAAHCERRPVAHWVALAAGVTAIVLGAIGSQLSNKVLGGLPGCARSPDSENGGMLIWLTFIVLTPTVIIASTVALVRWSGKWFVSLTSVVAVLLVLGIDGFIVHQAINWSFDCQW